MEKTLILKPFPMESLTPSKRVNLGEISKRIFNELNKIDLKTTFISFGALKNYFLEIKSDALPSPLLDSNMSLK